MMRKQPLSGGQASHPLDTHLIDYYLYVSNNLTNSKPLTKKVIGKTPRSFKGAIAHYLKTRENNPRQFDGAALRARNDLKHLYTSLRIKPGPRAQAILFDEQPIIRNRWALS
jgi:hypothetical protein